MWFWNIFKLLSDSLIKPKRAACGVKSGKSRSVSKSNKSLIQRLLVTEHLWKTWSVVLASVWKRKKKKKKALRRLSFIELKKFLIQIKHIINDFIMEAT